MALGPSWLLFLYSWAGAGLLCGQGMYIEWEGLRERELDEVFGFWWGAAAFCYELTSSLAHSEPSEPSLHPLSLSMWPPYPSFLASCLHSSLSPATSSSLIQPVYSSPAHTYLYPLSRPCISTICVSVSSISCVGLVDPQWHPFCLVYYPSL